MNTIDVRSKNIEIGPDRPSTERRIFTSRRLETGQALREDGTSKATV
jgi:hypothetical protein